MANCRNSLSNYWEDSYREYIRETGYDNKNPYNGGKPELKFGVEYSVRQNVALNGKTNFAKKY